VLEEAGTLKFAGYYTMTSDGVTNFYSPRGKRMFYNPKSGRGLYGGKDGQFCGVLGRIDGKMTLGLTERGSKILLLMQ
jgi:hypothetical protein